MTAKGKLIRDTGILGSIIIIMLVMVFSQKVSAQVDAKPMTEYTGQQIVRQLERQNDILKEILEQTERITDKVGR